MKKIKFANPYFPELHIDESYIVDEYYPRSHSSGIDRKSSIEQALAKPIGCERLEASVKANNKVLVLIDDKSRSTPVGDILPLVLAEIKAAGVAEQNVTIMVALGTHREMNQQELCERVGEDIYSTYKVINHQWNDPQQLAFMGKTEGGTDIWLNKLAVEADFIIGIGHIVPHRVVGYSGGCKIIQPGISGPQTTGQTHWLSAYYSAEEMLGQAENPVRAEIDAVGGRVAFKFIVNVVQDSEGEVAGVFAGHPVTAHRTGCKFSESIYGVSVKSKADIVITEAYPTESELWVATKALQAADIVVKPGGIIILLAECHEGISVSHGNMIEKHGFQTIEQVEKLVEKGDLQDLNVSSYLARVGNVLAKNRTILVSRGISPAQGEKLGFTVCTDVSKAWEKALAMAEEKPQVAVLHQGSELLPIVCK